jgi:hypothetical protein
MHLLPPAFEGPDVYPLPAILNLDDREELPGRRTYSHDDVALPRFAGDEIRKPLIVEDLSVRK